MNEVNNRLRDSIPVDREYVAFCISRQVVYKTGELGFERYHVRGKVDREFLYGYLKRGNDQHKKQSYYKNEEKYTESKAKRTSYAKPGLATLLV